MGRPDGKMSVFRRREREGVSKIYAGRQKSKERRRNDFAAHCVGFRWPARRIWPLGLALGARIAFNHKSQNVVALMCAQARSRRLTRGTVAVVHQRTQAT